MRDHKVVERDESSQGSRQRDEISQYSRDM